MREKMIKMRRKQAMNIREIFIYTIPFHHVCNVLLMALFLLLFYVLLYIRHYICCMDANIWLSFNFIAKVLHLMMNGAVQEARIWFDIIS